jgi:hypothetical protein
MSSISFKDKMVMHRHEDQQSIELSFKNLTPIPLVESGLFQQTEAVPKGTASTYQ